MRRSVVAILAVFALVFAFSAPAFTSTDVRVNINTASVKELSSLQKIGPKYSQRIVDYRDTIGPFETPEEIMKVKGISQKIFEMNKERIVVKDTTVDKKS